MKQVFTNILECVGDTPIVKLRHMGEESPHQFYVKCEFLNPGSSIKDRIALQMVADAEESGQLKPGGTIIECTSGNTGMGLAIVAAVKGYQSIFVMPDKVSDEKIKSLRALGARVITTPTAVEPEDPRSYYSVAKRLAAETPNSFYSNQYHNPSNPKAHYNTTGPEIWSQMGNELDYVVIASGTGGTITGIAKYLKEKNPKVKAICVDPEGSVFFEYFKTGKIPKLLTTYKVEGFGEDFLPSTIDFKLIDEIVQVNDRECFLTARELARKEGLFVGGSCGGAVAGALKYAKAVPDKKNFLIILPDHGSRYLSKFYDDDWMRDNRFLDAERLAGTVKDLLGNRYRKVITAELGETVGDIVRTMRTQSISQLPVLSKGKMVGLISEVDLLGVLLDGRASNDTKIDRFVEQNYSVLSPDSDLSKVSASFKQGQVVVVQDHDKVVGIITKIDFISFLSR